MIHHERWSGEVTIVICFVGRNRDNRGRYSGAIWLDVNGRRTQFKFKDMQIGVGGVSSGMGFGYEDEDEQAFDHMAGAIIDFLSYFTADERPDDPKELSGWVPPTEVCEALQWEAEHSENEGFVIRRERGGPIVYENGSSTPQFRIPCRPVVL